MKISSINNYQTYNKKISFGTIERIVYQPKENGGNKIRYRNNSYIFREDLDWNNLINHITRDNKPRKIYCYACSDGSEPYSIAIALISRLGWQNAQKYFPIIAKDSDDFVMNKIKNRTITLTKEDISRIEKFSKAPITNFFTKITNEYPCEYRTNNGLYGCIDFAKGDILKDKDSLDYDGSVILFRNVWPYLKRDNQIALLNTFSSKFSKDTSLVIGAYDLKEASADSKKNIFKTNIFDYGFWQIDPKIYQLHNTDTSYIE